MKTASIDDPAVLRLVSRHAQLREPSILDLTLTLQGHPVVERPMNQLNLGLGRHPSQTPPPYRCLGLPTSNHPLYD